MRNVFPWEFFIPKGAMKVQSKMGGECVAFIFENSKGKPAAKIFMGKQSKPFSFFYYSSEASRERDIMAKFAGVAASAKAKAERAEAKKAWVNCYKVGDVFRGSWGYDQTNVDFFEVVGVSGKMLSIRELAQDSSGDGWSGKCVPLVGAYVGPVVKVRAQENGIKSPKFGWASFMQPEMVGACKSYQPSYYSSYA